ncbi:uncharacterized protein LOC143430683 [Xylocopa sonorina]|uniref:uncharacterized protein LOC143430683 n=1 Tax=Xylocopa sonorina TaxID=1818115 RepID=UPI00403AAE6E
MTKDRFESIHLEYIAPYHRHLVILLAFTKDISRFHKSCLRDETLVLSFQKYPPNKMLRTPRTFKISLFDHGIREVYVIVAEKPVTRDNILFPAKNSFHMLEIKLNYRCWLHQHFPLSSFNKLQTCVVSASRNLIILEQLAAANVGHRCWYIVPRIIDFYL